MGEHANLSLLVSEGILYIFEFNLIQILSLWYSRKKLERSICPGLVVAARQSRVGSKFLNLKILIFLL